MKNKNISFAVLNRAFNSSLSNKIFLFLVFIALPLSAQTYQVSWFSFSNGFMDATQQNTSLRSIIGNPFVGTGSGEGSSISSGFFSNPDATGILTSTDGETNSSIPSSFELKQNYPNPFNPSTNIKFSLPEQSNVKIVIYDLLGRIVKTIVDDSRPAGSFNIMWNGKNENNYAVSSGIYFYSLNAVGADNKKFTSFKKMILLK